MIKTNFLLTFNKFIGGFLFKLPISLIYYSHKAILLQKLRLCKPFQNNFNPIIIGEVFIRFGAFRPDYRTFKAELC